ncbi:MAG: AEC family transporter [Pseudomonadales bacterium]|nr:AEC family transporter [Pseudomonadales bacterium]
MIADIFAIIAPIIFCATIGYAWARSRLHYDAEFVTRMVMNIGMPCLVISSMNKADPDFSTLSQILWISLFILVAMLIISYPVVKLCRHQVAVYLPPLLFPNNAFMGFPLCFFAFGDEGLALAIGFYLVTLIVNFSFGIMLVSQTSEGLLVRLKDLALQPVVWSGILALPMVIYDWSLPAWLANSTELLGAMSVPLMLVTLGVSLASLQTGTWQRNFWYSLLRVLGGFAIGLAAISVFHLSGTLRGVTLIQAAMPAAIFNYLLALRYQRSPSEVASLIVISTLITFILSPALISFALYQGD